VILVNQLNLKNDPLRRRFDSLKYDIKKIEEGEPLHELKQYPLITFLTTNSCI